MKAFRLVTVSHNRNSFGLRGCILVAEDGEAWEVGTNDMNCPQVARDYLVPQPTSAYFAHPESTRDFADQDAVTAGQWSRQGWEIPRRLPDCPADAVALVWHKGD